MIYNCILFYSFSFARFFSFFFTFFSVNKQIEIRERYLLILLGISYPFFSLLFFILPSNCRFHSILENEKYPPEHNYILY